MGFTRTCKEGAEKGPRGMNKEKVAELKALALEGNAEAIAWRLIEEVPRDLEKSAKILQAAEYVMNNAEWIGNIHFFSSGSSRIFSLLVRIWSPTVRMTLNSPAGAVRRLS